MTVSLLRFLTKPSNIVKNGRVYVQYQQRRFLDLHEFQSKQILHNHGVKVQKFKVVSNLDEIHKVMYPERFGQLETNKWSGFKDDISNSEEFVVKAQVLAGGRGKGKFMNSGLQGGVKLTTKPLEAESYAKAMLNDYLITKQTSSTGVLVERVMIAEAVRLRKEYYLAIVFDRSYDHGPIMVASPFGGMDIEEIATKNDTAIRRFTIPIDLELDLQTAQKMAVAAFDLNLTDLHIVDQCADQIVKLYNLFLQIDANQIEINPLGVTNKEEVIAVDAKIGFDENARFRHKDWIEELEQMNAKERDARDLAARENNLNYIGLDGDIGCLVNGAGLAMATMDIIKLHGGEPANFLDIGGGANAKQTFEALKIITSDIRVKSILINIFGGITRCDLIAQGIIDAMRELNIHKPIVCRLQGTEVEAAKRLLEGESSFNLISVDNLDEAADQVVRALRK